MKPTGLLILLVCIGLLGSACRPDPPESQRTKQSLEVVDYENGVFVIDFNRNWPNRLSRFIADHPDLRITAIAPASQGAYGAITSMLIVTEHR